MISQVDVFPTVCDLLATEAAGVARRQILAAGAARRRRRRSIEEIFAEVNYHASYEPKRAVRTQRWKYIRRYGDRTAPVLPNCDDSPSKSLWLEHNWRRRRSRASSSTT